MTPPSTALPRPNRSGGRLVLSLAGCPQDVRRCQQLRHEVFAAEMGARLPTAGDGLDRDRHDEVSRHIMVTAGAGGPVVATGRVIDQAGADRIGGFYSQGEFTLDAFLARRAGARILELGRTCVHPGYRHGPALAMLWHGVARLVQSEGIDLLIGCASIPLAHGLPYIRALCEHLRLTAADAADADVLPRTPLDLGTDAAATAVIPPPLLRAYLHQGARVSTRPHLDRDFGVADLFVYLSRNHIARRYRRRFLCGP